MNREQLIQAGLDAGFSSSEINKGLEDNGIQGLSRLEQADIKNGVYGKNLLEKGMVGAGKIVGGLGGLLGAGTLMGLDALSSGITGGQYSITPQGRQLNITAKEAVQDYVQDIANRGLVSGTGKIAEDVANFFLPPGATVESIKQDPIGTVGNVGANFLSDPAMGFLYTAPMIPKGLPAKALSKVPVIGQSAIRKGIMPTNEEKLINRVLNLSESKFSKESVEITKDIAEIESKYSTPQLLDAIENLTKGTTKPGTEQITKEVKAISDKLNNLYQTASKDVTRGRTTAINQYILETLDPQRNKGITEAAIKNAILEPTEKNLSKLGTTADELTQLVNKADELANQGAIAPITQRGLNTKTGIKDIDLSNIEQGSVTAERYLGTASLNDIAKNFTKGTLDSYNLLNQARTSSQALDDLLKVSGNRITPDELANIGKDKVVVSAKKYADDIQEAISSGKSDLDEVVKQTDILNNLEQLNKYADDLYVVDKSTMDAFKNKFGGVLRDEGERKVNDILKIIQKLQAPFKNTTLADVAYLASNRIGNLSLNLMEGADYAGVGKLLTSGKFNQLIPDYIKQTTSFHGLVPNVFDKGVGTQFKYNLKQAGKALQEVGEQQSLPGKMAKIGEALLETNRGMTSPIFQAESTLELLDRSANYLKQAEKLGKELGKTKEQILKDAVSDHKLQTELIDRVNQTLGDYVGRNYFASNTGRNFMQTLQPFIRVSNSMRDVMSKQLRDKPLEMHSLFIQPGRHSSEYIANMDRVLNQPTDMDSRGGYTTDMTFSRNFPSRKVYNSYSPFSAVIDPFMGYVLGDNFNKGGASFISDSIDSMPGMAYVNLIKGLDRYGNVPIGANTYSVNGKMVVMDGNGNELYQPSGLERYARAGASFARNILLPGANLLNTTVLPTLAGLTNTEYFSPTTGSLLGQFGDISIPGIMEGNKDNIPFSSPEIFYPSLLGTRFRDVYFPRTETMSKSLLQQASKKKAKKQILKQQRSN